MWAANPKPSGLPSKIACWLRNSLPPQTGLRNVGGLSICLRGALVPGGSGSTRLTVGRSDEANPVLVRHGRIRGLRLGDRLWYVIQDQPMDFSNEYQQSAESQCGKE